MKPAVIVAHPDDCVIFAWPIMRQLKELDWTVIYLTYNDADPRAQEMSAFWDQYGVKTVFLGYVDDYHDMERGVCSFDTVKAERNIKSHAQQYDLIITHNPDGDYGHIHHKFVSSCVAPVAGPAKIYFASTYNTDYIVDCDESYDLSQLPLHRDVIEGFATRYTGRYQYHCTEGPAFLKTLVGSMADIKKSEIIATQTFLKVLEGNHSILEIGPQADGWYTRHLLKKTKNVTVVDLDPMVTEGLSRDFPGLEVINSDLHDLIRKVDRKFDCVIIYGVLYHTPSPISILEDVANNLSPEYVFIESLLDRGLGVGVNEENINQSGMRQDAALRSSRLVLSMPQHVFDSAMTNLDYTLIGEFRPRDSEEFRSLPGSFKSGAIYTMWKRNNKERK